MGQPRLNIDAATAPVSLKNFRKDITIELLTCRAVVVKAYNVFRCWVSEYPPCPSSTPTPTPSRSRPSVQNEGFQPGRAVVEVAET